MVRCTPSAASCVEGKQAIPDTVGHSASLRAAHPTSYWLHLLVLPAVYTVTVSKSPTCTCPDARRRGDLCKHYLYVMIRVLRLPPDDHLVWQRGLLTAEVSPFGCLCWACVHFYTATSLGAQAETGHLDYGMTCLLLLEATGSHSIFWAKQQCLLLWL